jgi:hypothetical protein
MVSISRYPHPWPMCFVSSLSPYELEDAYNDILDTLDCIDLGFCGASRMLETAVRIYQYSLSHGSVFRVHHTMTALIERPSTPINIVQQAPAAPNVIVQQPQQPQQIVIQQAATPMITSSATQVARKEEIESLKREKEKMEQEAEIRKQRREVEELRERIARDEARERVEREQELQKQRETRRERQDTRRNERQDTRREERQETRRDDQRDERQEPRRSEQQDTRRDDLKFPQRSNSQPTRRAVPNTQTTPPSSRPTDTARDETRENRPKVNLYWSLGLDERTHPSSTQIKEAYKALSLRHHPDRNPSEHSA